MKATGLPARIVYAALGLVAGGAAGFYATMWLMPKLILHFWGADADVDVYGVFNSALGVGAGSAFTLFLVALTLPGKRHRRRSGRGGRVMVSCIFVVLASLAFAGLGHRLIYDLAFAAWLAYGTAYTYVRYGIIDQRRRRSISYEHSPRYDAS